MKFEATIKVVIEADNIEDARDVAFEAGQHLLETFNDDGSLSPMVKTSVVPVAE